MTTWTEATKQAETWTVQNTQGPRVFSDLVFSKKRFNGKHVFSMRDASLKREVWDDTTAQAETWVVIP